MALALVGLTQNGIGLRKPSCKVVIWVGSKFWLSLFIIRAVVKPVAWNLRSHGTRRNSGNSNSWTNCEDACLMLSLNQGAEYLQLG